MPTIQNYTILRRGACFIAIADITLSLIGTIALLIHLIKMDWLLDFVLIINRNVFKDKDVPDAILTQSVRVLNVILLVGNALWFIVSCVLYHGVRKERPRVILAWIVASNTLLGIGIAVFLVIYCFSFITGLFLLNGGFGMISRGLQLWIVYEYYLTMPSVSSGVIA